MDPSETQPEASQPAPEVKPDLIGSGQAEKKKESFGTALLAKLGLGGSAAGGSAGAAAGVGTGILASKAGVAALVLAGTSVAAGIGVLMMTPDQKPARAVADEGPSVFAIATDGKGAMARAAAEQQAAVQPAPSDGVSTSLDFLRTANNPKEPPVEDDAIEQAEESTERVDSGVEAPDHRNAPAASGRMKKKPFKRGKFAKGKGLGARGGGATRATLTAQAGLSGGSMGGFEKVYRAPRNTGGMKKGTNAKMAARRRTSSSRRSRASKQLVKTNRAVRSHARQASVSSAGYGTTYDGSTQANSIGGDGGDIGAEGDNTGGDGVSKMVNPSTAKDLRKTPPAPDPGEGENETPYQDLIKKAMLAMAISGALLLVANQVKKGNPIVAKILAGLALAAALYCGYLGMQMMQEDNGGQTGQGMIWIMVGLAFGFHAGRVIFEESSDKQAEAKSKADTEGTRAGMKEKLGVKTPPEGAAAASSTTTTTTTTTTPTTE